MAKSFKVIKNAQGKVLNPEVVSRTKQSFRAESNINTIVAKARVRGYLVDPALVSKRQAIFGDFSNVPDYLETRNRIAQFNSEFETLDGQVRARFDNNPALLIAFLADSANDAEAVKLGLKVAPPKSIQDGAPAPAPVPAPAGVPAAGSQPVGS